jgi:hypothetical protein
MFALLFAFSLNAQCIQYEGLGILKVEQGDMVKIKPDRAFVINTDVYQLCLASLDYVENNKADEVISLQKSQIRIQEIKFDNQSNLLNECLDNSNELFDATERSIITLQKINTEQSDKIRQLIFQSEEMNNAIDTQQKKVRRRNISLASIGIIAAWLGFEYFR